MINFVDRFLNHITMYRLVLYYVMALLVGALVLSFFGMTPHSPLNLVLSTAFITCVCWAANRAMALAFKVPANTESIYITAFILALIMPPVELQDFYGYGGLALASVAAIASKFILAIYRKHIFNPVAVGVVASGFILDQPPTWWVGGNLELMALVVLGGFLILRKVQRFEMFVAYVLANLAMIFVTASPDMYGEAFTQTLLYSPLLFAGFAMLTEPLTAPAALKPSMIFGAIVGALSSPNVHYGEFYFTPELAFLVGNAFAWAVSPKHRFKLTLERIEKQAHGCFDYVFKPHKPVSFKAGQYFDWTLNVAKPDDRGNRRAFTIASSPSENELRLGVKFYAKPSAFKQELLQMKPGDVVFASQLAGEFVLPKSINAKLAFIAGGIGVTPFRSMVQHMIDNKDYRSTVLLYGNNRMNEIAYSDVFEKAASVLDFRTIYAVAEDAALNMHNGFIDAALIKREMPDFRERLFYISGPRGMVVKFQKTLQELGIAKSRIKTDFFPGFA
jgi:glycine betaine catabolism B